MVLIGLPAARAQSAAPQYYFSHLAGPPGGRGNADGLGAAASFGPLRGHADGVGAAGQFNTSMGIAVDRTGNLYVADSGNNSIHQGQLAGSPVIITQPQYQTVAPGASAQLSVIASGVPSPTDQWYFNGSPFSGATSNTLTFANAHASDAGDYTVVFSNELGSVTSTSATVTVSAAAVTGVADRRRRSHRQRVCPFVARAGRRARRISFAFRKSAFRHVRASPLTFAR